jgi:hypothetical protein
LDRVEQVEWSKIDITNVHFSYCPIVGWTKERSKYWRLLSYKEKIRGQIDVTNVQFFLKVAAVKPPIVARTKDQRCWRLLSDKEKIGTHLSPPLYQGHLYK